MLMTTLMGRIINNDATVIPIQSLPLFTGTLLPAEQPHPQRRQDKGDDHGLEEAKERACPRLQRWSCSG